MKQKLKFSHFTTSDLPLIMPIERKIYPNPWPEKIMVDCINAGYQCIKGTLEHHSDQVVCYAILMIGFKESNLLNIGVHAELQQQSFASQLMHHLLLISRINHANSMWLEVRESNEAAIKLYKKFNFTVTGNRKNYYQYNDSNGERIKEDAILMSRKVVLPK